MNFRRTFERGEESFQLAPLVDIVFLLLIFFLVTWTLGAEERETPVDLPKTTAAIARKRDKMDVIVNITSSGRILINNQPYSVEKLRRVLTQLQRTARTTSVSVIIRADRKALYEDLVKVIDACAAARLKHVSFVSIDAGTRPIR